MANTNTTYTSIITASSNNIISGQTLSVPTYPINAYQINNNYQATFGGTLDNLSPIIPFRYHLASEAYGNYVYITSQHINGAVSRVLRMCQTDNLASNNEGNRFHSLYEAILDP
ncbi:hypothetical protein, partial [Salmonella sp. s51228]|uniref:hypothetical protein n=1 Tax=Salmonella sp. s51228 TaxID=3159652 RepID=UPI00397F8943